MGCTQDQQSITKNSAEISFISKDQLNAGGIKIAEKFTNDRSDYESRAKEMKLYLNQQGLTNNFINGELYSVTDFKDNQVEMLLIKSENGINKYLVKRAIAGNNSEYFLLNYGKASKALPGNSSSFAFELKTLSGDIVASSSPSFVQSARIQSWWSCVQNEYNSLCGGSFWRTIACDAGTIGCPECGAVVLAAWAISCSW